MIMLSGRLPPLPLMSAHVHGGGGGGPGDAVGHSAAVSVEAQITRVKMNIA